MNGRKIDVDMVDDQSSAVNKTAAQDLVQNKHVFMIVNNSSFPSFFNTYKYLQDAKVPQVNGGYDGTYYGEPGNEDIISALGNVVAAEGVTYDGIPKLMKAMGASKTRGGRPTATRRHRPPRRRTSRSSRSPRSPA